MSRTEVKYGEPRFKLDIKIVYPIRWENESNAFLKKAVGWAKGLLSQKYVTIDGYLRSAAYGEPIPDLPTVTATLDLEKNLVGLNGIVEMKPDARIHIEYGRETTDSIGVESGKGLYIVALK